MGIGIDNTGHVGFSLFLEFIDEAALFNLVEDAGVEQA
jgi:hypothetical protein